MKSIFSKIILAAITVGVIATSCSRDKQIDPVKFEKIEFKVLSDKTTKGSVTDGTNFLDFKVYAYASPDATLPASGMTPDFMYGISVSRATTASVWAYSPEQYWPTSNNVHFFAYGPAASTAASFATAANTVGQPVVNYTVPTAIASQEDFIWANVQGCNKTAPGTSPVQMTFKHALSQIVFEAKSAAESVEFSISKIELLGLKNTNSFNLNSGTWGTATGAVDYTIENTLLANNTAIGSSNFVSLTGTSGVMLVMPQSLVGGQASPINLSSGTYLRITYGAKDKVSQNELVATGTELIVPFSLLLEQNKKYIIQMTLTGGSDLVKIKFSGTVSDWENGGISSITM